MKLLVNLSKIFITFILLLGILSNILIILIFGVPVCLMTGKTFKDLFLELSKNLSEEFKYGN